jgi:hypothetical protein
LGEATQHRHCSGCPPGWLTLAVDQLRAGQVCTTPSLHPSCPRLQTAQEAMKSQDRRERRGEAGTSPDLLPLLQTHAGGTWVARHSSRQHQKRLCWPSQASRMSQRMLHETGAWLTCISASRRSPEGGGPSGLLLQHSTHPPVPPHSPERPASSCKHHPAASSHL